MVPQPDHAPPDGITREPLHLRQIDMRGYRRSDGLFEASACLTDRKMHDFAPPGGTRVVLAQSPIHDLGVTLVFDIDMVVREVRTFIRSHPYAPCPGGGDSLQALVGLRIGAGWNSEVRKRLPSCDTCTHLKEILGPLASAAFQTMVDVRPSSLDNRDGSGKPVKIDSCYAYGASRDLVKALWPDHHRPAQPANEG
ncbi:DUF2889 domain-containing protein [Burkholderia stagnalis]|uniref:DUF2889 domain-containing protein n=1 Tax=Burkholderia stagnalis TaxID=1503054 RepID=UPI000305E330|nr:DUF2889 domain-containing protein [Burkholderia stagnalis]